ncbi:MAG: shikimate dehydrogenase [Muribaculaceae bacterium]|nr:shikimate dehydrogenase [Muribaculaceae bacterium]
MHALKDLYGLVGYPLGHSFSKSYFTHKFLGEGINAGYENFELDDIALIRQVIEHNDNLRGFNVTIPYKEQILPYLDSLDEVAAEIGAVNVVRIENGGKLRGFNTDVYGFTESLRPMLAHYNHKKALVFGTGGASKAVLAGLKELGIEATVVSRKQIANGLTYSDLTPAIIGEHTVIVNTTPLGMYPYVDAAPIMSYSALTSNHVCFDLVYNPTQTKFMNQCAEMGAMTSNGLKMLHLQAEQAWRIWQNAK